MLKLTLLTLKKPDLTLKLDPLTLKKTDLTLKLALLTLKKSNLMLKLTILTLKLNKVQDNRFRITPLVVIGVYVRSYLHQGLEAQKKLRNRLP